MMRRDRQHERLWRRRITSGVFKAMAATGRMDRALIRDGLGVSADTVNRWLDGHKWTLPAFVAVSALYGKTPAEVLALGAETGEENLP